MVVADALKAELASRMTLAARSGSLPMACVSLMADTSGSRARFAIATALAGIIGVYELSERCHSPESSQATQA